MDRIEDRVDDKESPRRSSFARGQESSGRSPIRHAIEKTAGPGSASFGPGLCKRRSILCSHEYHEECDSRGRRQSQALLRASATAFNHTVKSMKTAHSSRQLADDAAPMPAPQLARLLR